MTHHSKESPSLLSSYLLTCFTLFIRILLPIWHSLFIQSHISAFKKLNPYKQSNCITDGQRLALLCFSRGPVDRSGLVSLARWGTEGLQLPINSSNNKSIWMENELVGFRTCFPRTGKTGKPGSRGKTKLGRTAPSPPARLPHRPRSSSTEGPACAPRIPDAHHSGAPDLQRPHAAPAAWGPAR